MRSQRSVDKELRNTGLVTLEYQKKKRNFETMPIYPMKNTETGEVTEMFLSFAERDKFLADNPNYIQSPTSPRPGNVMGMGDMKLSDGFKDILKNIKKSHRNTTMEF